MLVAVFIMSEQKGDLIYDPFSGSGSTLLTAKAMERNFIGSELSKEYVEATNAKLCGGLFSNSFQTELSNEGGT